MHALWRWVLNLRWVSQRFKALPSKPETSDQSPSDPEGGPRLFALFIGIDEYASDEMLWLRGAVSDASAMCSYLQSTFGIPTGNIVKLFNKDATRNAIISAFKGLITDERIAKNDPILIYYAGHGASIDSPQAWQSDMVSGKVEAILPYDFHTLQRGKSVDAIPDRTIGSLLHKLSENKGDNIVSCSLPHMRILRGAYLCERR